MILDRIAVALSVLSRPAVSECECVYFFFVCLTVRANETRGCEGFISFYFVLVCRLFASLNPSTPQTEPVSEWVIIIISFKNLNIVILVLNVRIISQSILTLMLNQCFEMI